MMLCSSAFLHLDHPDRPTPLVLLQVSPITSRQDKSLILNQGYLRIGTPRVFHFRVLPWYETKYLIGGQRPYPPDNPFITKQPIGTFFFILSMLHYSQYHYMLLYSNISVVSFIFYIYSLD
jgi:hypothetical protein